MKKILIPILITLAFSSFARNYPCSGRKGGINHCEGIKFVCNDGSYSHSQQQCSIGDAEEKTTLVKAKTHIHNNHKRRHPTKKPVSSESTLG